MTRLERIYEASEFHKDYVSQDFIDGAEWADEHPNWHNLKNDLPEENKEYLIAIKDGYVTTAMYCYIRNKEGQGCYGFTYGNCTSDIVAWMELPAFDPKSIK